MIPTICTNLVLCSTYENMIWSRKNTEFSNFGLKAGMFIKMSVVLYYLENYGEQYHKLLAVTEVE